MIRLLVLLAALAGVLGPAAAPSVAFDWTGAHEGLVTWSGPGILVVANGGQPYPLSDIVTDDALRVTQLGPGGDTRSIPYPGMLLEVRDLGGVTLAAVTVPEPPPPVHLVYAPLMFKGAGP